MWLGSFRLCRMWGSVAGGPYGSVVGLDAPARRCGGGRVAGGCTGARQRWLLAFGRAGCRGRRATLQLGATLGKGFWRCDGARCPGAPLRGWPSGRGRTGARLHWLLAFGRGWRSRAVGHAAVGRIREGKASGGVAGLDAPVHRCGGWPSGMGMTSPTGGVRAGWLSRAKGHAAVGGYAR